MEICSVLLDFCAEISPVTGEFPSQRPLTRIWCFFDMRVNNWLDKQSLRRWFEMPSRSLWGLCNVIKQFCNVCGKRHADFFCAQCFRRSFIFSSKYQIRVTQTRTKWYSKMNGIPASSACRSAGNMKPSMYNVNFPDTEPNFTVQKQNRHRKTSKERWRHCILKLFVNGKKYFSWLAVAYLWLQSDQVSPGAINHNPARAVGWWPTRRFNDGRRGGLLGTNFEQAKRILFKITDTWLAYEYLINCSITLRLTRATVVQTEWWWRDEMEMPS